MIDGLRPYPEYRDTGLLWLPTVPAHWQILRGKSVFSPVDVRSKTGREELLTVSASDGVRPRSQKAVTMFMANSYVGHKLCWPGDLVVNSLWAWMQGLGFSSYHGLISSAYSVYRPRPMYAAHWQFHDYLLRSAVYKWELQVRSKGVWLSRLQLLDTAFMDMPIVLPTADDVSLIVRFLNHANRHIERFIRAKRKLIALLNEQKQAIIQQVVTRGLDPNVRLKPSGVPWLGEIPEHWETITVGVGSVLIQTGPFGSQLHSHDYVQGGIPVINPCHMRNGRINADPSVTVSPHKLRELERHRLCTGDIVAARRGELGRCAVVNAAQQGWLCGTGSLLIRCKPSVFGPEYFQQVFSSQGVRDSLSLASIGATMENLNAGMVARLRLPCPPPSEQLSIVRFVVDESRQQASATTIVEREIALLREYRTRLVADVVTGQLDVREAARRLPDEDDEAQTDTVDEELEHEGEGELEPEALSL